ncbi:MAG TPA: sodium:alanine symporter family protein [Mogibacterium sp.]|nr:sodium:alanine symporter family protein [Mogibacterium sp.]
MEAFSMFLDKLGGIVWGWPMIILLLGTHIYMTFRTGFIQIPSITKGIKLSVTADTEGEGEVSNFGALTTALAATIGTGNIIGVGTAVFLGGPGAVLWVWLTGCFGIATKYAESLIAIKYRVKTRDGRMQGGAMYALKRGLNMPVLGFLFALFGGLASFGIGNATQVNAIATVANTNFGIPYWIVGVVVAGLTAIVIFGGIKSIAAVCEKLVPFMAIFYVLGCAVILVMNFDFIIPALKAIGTLAFTPGAVAGGLVGGGLKAAIRYGVARGLFSNESGMGSAPIAAAAAQTRNPVRQALVSSTGVFWDTVIVCAMTGLTIVTSFMKYPEIDTNNITNGGEMTSAAFSTIPVIGPAVLTLGLITFAYSTILGWAYYGERCIEYVGGAKALIPYRVIYILISAIAPIVKLDIVWTIADILNAFMTVPNLIAVLLLSPVIVSETKKYINDIGLADDEPVPYIDEI